MQIRPENAIYYERLAVPQIAYRNICSIRDTQKKIRTITRMMITASIDMRANEVIETL